MESSVANLPLYLQPWWWDAATGNPDRWQAATIQDQEGRLQAYWPYCLQRRLGFIKLHSLPPLTMHSGPWLRPPLPETKPAKVLSRNWKLIEALLQQLPQAHYQRAKAPYSFQNGMALQRAGWRQTVKYSYQLPTHQLATTEEIQMRFAPHVRQQLKKARSIVAVKPNPTIDIQLSLIHKAFEVRGAKTRDFPDAAFHRLYQATRERAAAVSWQAVDDKERIHATLWMAYDEQTAYAILPAADPALRTSGAMSLLLWQGIDWAQQQGLIFDFEGSAIPGVEEFYRGFGPDPIPYYIFQKGLAWL